MSACKQKSLLVDHFEECGRRAECRGRGRPGRPMLQYTIWCAVPGRPDKLALRGFIDRTRLPVKRPGCEVRPCDPFARMRPCVPCVPCVSRLPPVSFYYRGEPGDTRDTGVRAHTGKRPGKRNRQTNLTTIQFHQLIGYLYDIHPHDLAPRLCDITVGEISYFNLRTLGILNLLA